MRTHGISLPGRIKMSRLIMRFKTIRGVKKHMERITCCQEGAEGWFDPREREEEGVQLPEGSLQWVILEGAWNEGATCIRKLSSLSVSCSSVSVRRVRVFGICQCRLESSNNLILSFNFGFRHCCRRQLDHDATRGRNGKDACGSRK